MTATAVGVRGGTQLNPLPLPASDKFGAITRITSFATTLGAHLLCFKGKLEILDLWAYFLLSYVPEYLMTRQLDSV